MIPDDPVGIDQDLPDLIARLGMTVPIFLLWRNALLSTSVRDALAWLQKQNCQQSASECGKPLWPVWLIEEIIARPDSMSEVHLALALVTHHLPHLPSHHQARLILLCISLATKFGMAASVPKLVSLALMAGPQLSEHPSYDPAYIADLSTFYNKLLVILSHLKFAQRCHASMYSSVSTTLQAMLDLSIPLERNSVDLVFRAYAGHSTISNLLFEHMKRWNLPTRPHYINHLLKSAVQRHSGQIAPCQNALADTEASADADIPATTENRPHPSYNRGSLIYIKSLRSDPAEAVAYHARLCKTLTSHPKFVYPRRFVPKRSQFARLNKDLAQESELSIIIAHSWDALVRVLSLQADSTLDELEKLLDDSRSFWSRRARLSTYRALMWACQRRSSYEGVMSLWRRMLAEGLEPTPYHIGIYFGAASRLKVAGIALRDIDAWAYRPGVHQLVRKGAADPAYVWVRPISDPDAPPELKVKLDSHALTNIIRSLRSRTREPEPEPDDYLLAVRIWESAPVRWGAEQSDLAFIELLEAARQSVWDDYSTCWRSNSTTALNLVGEGLELREGRINWAKCSVDQFFVPPEEPIELEPWDRERRRFQSIMLDNFPELTTLSHPFDELADAVAAAADDEPYPTVFDAFNVSHLFDAHSPAPRPRPQLQPTHVAAGSAYLSLSYPVESVLKSFDLDSMLPARSPHYAHLVPSRSTYHAYIRLLAYHSQADDIPMILAWMRHLEMKPKSDTVELAVATLAAAEIARVQAGEVDQGNDKKLYVWLRDWLGESQMPGDDRLEKATGNVQRWYGKRELILRQRRKMKAKWDDRKQAELLKACEVRVKRSMTKAALDRDEAEQQKKGSREREQGLWATQKRSEDASEGSTEEERLSGSLAPA